MPTAPLRCVEAKQRPLSPPAHRDACAVNDPTRPAPPADYMAPEVERCPLKHRPEDNKDNTALAYTSAIE